MKFTLSWLREYCRCDIVPEKLEELLTLAGLKVESMTQEQGDVVFELELTSNRPDCLGILGVAREVALLAGAELRLPKVDVPAEPAEETGGARVAIEEPELCPRYIARVLRGVTVRSSPTWLAKRIESIGLRPVNNVVDVTNFVLYESGQPLHAFDLERLDGRRIVVRRAKDGEKLVAIDGKTYVLPAATLVIADARVPVAIAGVMGGRESEVGDGTKDVLLECACFAPASVRRTSRALALSSDSSYRFERGINVEQMDWASRRAAALLRECAGGELLPAVVDVNHVKPVERRVRLRSARLEKLLGRRIDAALVERILRGLGFDLLTAGPEEYDLRVPAHRGDIALEEDLVEEVARIYGYDRIPVTPRIRIAAAPESHRDRVRRRTREVLVGAGLWEALTHSFLDERFGEDFAWPGDGAPVGILNRDGKVGTKLRKSVLPGLLMALRTNDSHAADTLGFFEIAKAYFHGPDGRPAERHCLALVHREGFAALRGALDLAAAHLGVPAPSYEPADGPCLHPGRAAQVLLAGRPAGFAGEVVASVATRYDLRKPPAALELDFDAWTAAVGAGAGAAFREFSRYPEVQRDLALLFDGRVPWRDVESCVRSAAPAFLEELRFFDLYRGKGIPDGKKSLAFSLVFRAADRTLTGSEADAAVQSILGALKARFECTLRA